MLAKLCFNCLTLWCLGIGLIYAFITLLESENITDFSAEFPFTNPVARKIAWVSAVNIEDFL